MSAGQGIPERGSGTPTNDSNDIRRRVENLVRYGKIHEVRYSPDLRARVRAGRIITAWLPLAALRAWNDYSIHPVEIGEQVIVLSAGGRLEQGVILPLAIYQRDTDPPAHRHVGWDQSPTPHPDLDIMTYKDGTQWKHDRKNHVWSLVMNTGGTFRVEIGDATLEMTQGSVRLSVGLTSVSLTGDDITNVSEAISTHASGTVTTNASEKVVTNANKIEDNPA